MSTTTDTARNPEPPASKDPYIRGTDETVLLDLRELRAQEAADQADRHTDRHTDQQAGRQAPAGPGAELERYHGSHRRDAVLYADGGTAIPLDRVREVCHDLRQPVAAILMLASAAEMRPDVPERVRETLQEIMTQTEDISATVRQFLDDAKQGVDGLGEPVPCNVAGLAAESVERWRATFDGDLALAAAEDPLHVTVDPVLFKRALGNVLSNGTRAAGESGRVQVTVRRFETAQGERAVIEVDDSGPGFGNIPAGHGLGLAVVRRTIEAAGGAVEVAEGPLGGALVRLVLPVTPIRPLSANDELTKTFHGEITLSELAAQLAMGNLHKALADFDDDDDDDDETFEVDDSFEVFDEFDDDAPAAVANGHTLTTRISAWPEPVAISGTPEQLAIGGAPEQGNLFGGDNRSYFGLPVQPTIADREIASAREIAPEAGDDRGFFGLPLKNDGDSQPSVVAPAQIAAPMPMPIPTPIPVPQAADIAAHPVPTGLFSPHRDASQAPYAQAEIAAAAQPTRPTAPQPAVAAVAASLPAASTAPQPPIPPVAAPTFDPGDTQPLHIIPTGQDDTALASIQLPSQTNLTHPPRIPAAALRPVAEVQLSLLPGGAF